MVKVLVIDDVEIVFSAFKEELGKESFQVDTALSGESALEKVKSNHYDVIFIDLFMPEMDGVKTCEAINRLKPESRMIAFTGNIYAGLADKELAFKKAGGEIHYLYKPFLKGEILKSVKEALGRLN